MDEHARRCHHTTRVQGTWVETILHCQLTPCGCHKHDAGQRPLQHPLDVPRAEAGAPHRPCPWRARAQAAAPPAPSGRGGAAGRPLGRVGRTRGPSRSPRRRLDALQRTPARPARAGRAARGLVWGLCGCAGGGGGGGCVRAM
jgi:hypothetical protein